MSILLLAACAARPAVPAELVRDGLLFVNGTIAGCPATMLLDTGSWRTVVASTFAQRIGLPTDGGAPVTAVGVGGNVAAGIANNVAVKFGSAQSTMAMVVAPLDAEPFLGRELQVILGRDVFTAFVVEMDYSNERVTFHERESFRYQGPGVTLPMRRGRLDSWCIELDIEDFGPAFFDLDTGDNGTLIVYAPYVAEHRLLDGRPRGTGMQVGIGGVSEVATTRLARVGLGGVVFHDVPIATDKADVGILEGAATAGSLGGQMLSRYRLFVDGWRRQVHLEQIAERVAAPFTRNRSGLATAHRGSHLEVLHVVAGSPAAEAGFAVGDRIRAIDGVDVAVGYWDRTWRWVQQPQGTVVTIDLVGGERRKFALGEVP